MSNLPLTNKSFYKGDGNPYKDIIKATEILQAELKKTAEEAQRVAKNLSVQAKTNPKQTAKDYKQLATTITDLGRNVEAANKANKEAERLDITKRKLLTEQAKLNARNTVAIQNQRKALKDQAKESLGLVGAYQKLSKQTNEAQKRFKNLAAEFGANSKQARSAKKEFEQLDGRLRKVNDAAKDGRRDVGRYEKGWAGVKKLLVGGLGILGITRGFQLLKQAFTSVINQFSTFEKSVSKVAAISGASANEIKALRTQAQDLGETTEKTAAQVASLQLELAKLGFNPRQIQDATGSILDLSTAIDAELGQSAAVVGSTIRAFGLQAEDTARVTDVMALSFSRSSLDINKFQTAMASVAPVARKFGFSLEETTSLLAQLTDAGLDASSAGTATRKILLNLADSSGDLAQSLGRPVNNLEDLLGGLTKLRDEGTDLAKALELTDVRSVTAFSTFLDGVDSTRKLSNELNGAAGSASRMANIMRDNLAGDADKARSAIEGLQINIGQRLAPALRGVTQGFTSLVSRLNELVKIKASEEIEAERAEVIKLVSQLQNANTSYEERVALLNKLNGIAPDVVKGIDAEKVAYEDLNNQLNVYLSTVIKRIAIAELEAEKTEELNKLGSILLEQNENLYKAQELLLKVNGDLVSTEGDLQKQIQGTIDNLREYVKANGEYTQIKVKGADGTISYVETLTQEAAALRTLEFRLNKDRELQEELRKATEDTITPLDKKIQILKNQLGITEDQNTANTDAIKTQKEITKAVREFIREVEKAQSVASEGIKIEYGKELDTRSDLEKFQDDLFAENIRKSQAYNDELLEQVQERQNKIKEIESEGYNSVLGIFFNFKRQRIAEDKNLTKELRDQQIAENRQQEAAVQQLADTLISIYNQILETRLQQIESQIQAKNQQIDEQEEQVNRELSLLQAGAANEFEIEKEKLKKLQEERDRDLEKKKEIQKKQEQINTLTQISELATAVATIINSAVSELGWAGVVAGIAAAAAAIIGFTTYKSEAESAATAEDGGTFTKEGTRIEKGKRHKDGGNKYSSAEFEQGEAVSVFSRKATSKYQDEIFAFENALNNDQFEMYKASMANLNTNNVLINNDYSKLLREQQKTNTILQKNKNIVYKNGSLYYYTYDGRLIETNA